MLSRLYDERIFKSSQDVVFSTSSSQALRHKSDRTARRPLPSSRRQMRHDDPLHEEEEESKSDASSDEEDAPADDELDEEDEEEEEEEEDEDEKRRTAGLKFPLQSPRHIAASQQYIHRCRHADGPATTLAASPTARRRHARKLLDTEHASSDRDVVPLKSNTPVSKDIMRRKIQVQYHDHPMELVYLPTGQIRARDECPPGLQLPPMTDVRKLLEAPPSPEGKEQVRRRVKPTVDKSNATEHTTRQAKGKDSVVAPTERWQRGRPEAIETNGTVRKQPNGQRRNREPSPASSDSEHHDSTESDHVGKRRDDTRRKTQQQDSPIHHTKKSADVIVSQSASAMSREDTNGTVPAMHPHRFRRNDPESEEEHVDRLSHTRHASSNSTRNLEAELQKEKKRVLQKMTQLLEEQGKTQALQHQLQILQDKVAGLERELETSARRGAERLSPKDGIIRERDERIRVLSDEVRSKDDVIHRLQAQLEQSEMSNRDRTNKISPKGDDKIMRLRQREAALAKQLEDLMNRVTDFHSQVECWKVNSREALDGFDKRTDVLELMDRLWMDFPPFISSSEPPAHKNSTEGESSTIAFLTKKLRQKEEELRLTHVKYVELKELCARQCIREADLQNFINEHRLRGNLVIRKTEDSGTARAASNRERDHPHVQANGQKHSSSGHHRGNQASDSEDYDEEEPDTEQVVRRPKVFIDIKRSNQQSEQQQEQSPIEHVRLAPSPALVQRYHQQQFQTPVRQSTTRSTGVHSGRTTRAATVASASRTLATTRQTIANRTTTAQRRPAAGGTSRTATTGRATSIMSKNTSVRGSVASRRPSQPLTSRPWV